MTVTRRPQPMAPSLELTIEFARKLLEWVDHVQDAANAKDWQMPTLHPATRHLLNKAFSGASITIDEWFEAECALRDFMKRLDPIEASVVPHE